MTIVVKIGSQSLLQAGPQPGGLDRQVMASLVGQIAGLKAQGHSVYLVSSGAVAAGRSLWPGPGQPSQTLPGGGHQGGYRGGYRGNKLGETACQQLWAGLGQVELMQAYQGLAAQHQLQVVQLLLTKGDFLSRNHYLHLERLLSSLQYCPELLPIINENDSVSVEELMFTDNDQLAGVLAQQLDAEALLLLTEAAGIYDRSPQQSEAQLLPVLGLAGSHWPKLEGRSPAGRGGVGSKLETAKRMSRAGVVTCIACARSPQILPQIVAELAKLQAQLAEQVQPPTAPAAQTGQPDSDILQQWCANWSHNQAGTVILPKTWSQAWEQPGRTAHPRGLRKWLSARHLAAGNARIVVNECLAQKLREQKQALSILPVGILSYSGPFAKGDLIDIYSPQQQRLGIGLARYNGEQLARVIRQKNQATFIHYNYLYIEG